MKRILQFELHKLFRLKSFYICIAITFISAFLNLYLTWDLLQEMNIPGAVVQTNLSGKSAMLSATYDANYTLIMSIFAVLYACNDFDNQTAKNMYARGFSKTKIYFVKWLVLFAVLSAVFVANVLF